MDCNLRDETNAFLPKSLFFILLIPTPAKQSRQIAALKHASWESGLQNVNKTEGFHRSLSEMEHFVSSQLYPQTFLACGVVILFGPQSLLLIGHWKKDIPILGNDICYNFIVFLPLEEKIVNNIIYHLWTSVPSLKLLGQFIYSMYYHLFTVKVT